MFNTLRELAKTARRNKQVDLLVVSPGGAGTTFVLEFFGQHMRTNYAKSEWDGLKHINRPDHPILRDCRVKRCLYLYAEPVQTVLSLFRRDFQTAMAYKTTAQFGSVWDYRRGIKRALSGAPLAFEDYLRSGVDAFGLEAHFSAWTRPENPPFPILCQKYETLFDHLDELLEFSGIPAEHFADFPAKKERNSTPQALPADQRAVLERICEGASEIYRGNPERIELEPR